MSNSTITEIHEILTEYRPPGYTGVRPKSRSSLKVSFEESNSNQDVSNDYTTTSSTILKPLTPTSSSSSNFESTYHPPTKDSPRVSTDWMTGYSTTQSISKSNEPYREESYRPPGYGGHIPNANSKSVGTSNGKVIRKSLEELKLSQKEQREQKEKEPIKNQPTDKFVKKILPSIHNNNLNNSMTRSSSGRSNGSGSEIDLDQDEDLINHYEVNPSKPSGYMGHIPESYDKIGKTYAQVLMNSSYSSKSVSSEKEPYITTSHSDYHNNKRNPNSSSNTSTYSYSSSSFIDNNYFPELENSSNFHHLQRPSTGTPPGYTGYISKVSSSPGKRVTREMPDPLVRGPDHVISYASEDKQYANNGRSNIPGYTGYRPKTPQKHIDSNSDIPNPSPNHSPIPYSINSTSSMDKTFNTTAMSEFKSWNKDNADVHMHKNKDISSLTSSNKIPGYTGHFHNKGSHGTPGKSQYIVVDE